MNNPSKVQKILVILNEPQAMHLMERLLKSAGYLVGLFPSLAAAQGELENGQPQLVIIGDTLEGHNGLSEAEHIVHQYPAVPVLLFSGEDRPELLKEALQLGVSGYLCPPLRTDDILKAVDSSLEKASRTRDWVLFESRRATGHLRKRVDELETLSRLGQSITAQLDTDNLLTAIVEAAVELTGAEEGSLLLIEKDTDQLYIRASKNFQEDFVRTFRLPIQDTLAGNVLRSGEPVVVDESTPQKIKTSYLVHSLIYVPLLLQTKVIGVLGVDNRNNRLPFQKHDIDLLGTLAEYAVIALLNANLYTDTQMERNKLETILRRVQDGVVVVDRSRRVLIINQAAEVSLGVVAAEILGKPAGEALPQPEVVSLFEAHTGSLSNRTEFSTVDNRVFSAQLSPIPEVGAAVTLHDITYLRKLDRMKNDFVGTVSHDLRSPLTAILGYAELVERAGPVNDLQAEFIRRVQSSVTHISHLVDDLVSLGRIQTGFDSRNEILQLSEVLKQSVDTYMKVLVNREIPLEIDLPSDLPPFYGNPVQLRRLFENIIDNCIKYSSPGGKIQINGKIEQNQVILQFIDEGPGIPVKDMPYVFDKFFRGSNNTPEQSGTGLGLAIVKSVAEAHDGRVWIDSVVDQGTTLTVVLPIQEAPAK